MLFFLPVMILIFLLVQELVPLRNTSGPVGGISLWGSTSPTPQPYHILDVNLSCSSGHQSISANLEASPQWLGSGPNPGWFLGHVTQGHSSSCTPFLAPKQSPAGKNKTNQQKKRKKRTGILSGSFSPSFFSFNQQMTHCPEIESTGQS